MADKIIHRDKAGAEQNAADDVAEPVHAGKQSADEHEDAEGKNEKRGASSEQNVLYADR